MMKKRSSKVMFEVFIDVFVKTIFLLIETKWGMSDLTYQSSLQINFTTKLK